jgi:3-oxosteroid 1-dehydrogenase
MTTAPAAADQADVVDAIVLGSGAAGLVAALAAADAGASVRLYEKTDAIGGTTAISGGTCWVPNNRHAGFEADERDRALAYLASLSHGFISDDLAAAFVDHGPLVIEWIESVTDLTFSVVTGFPDYHPEHPGGRPDGGRSLDPGLFSYPSLGEWADRVVRPAKNPHLTLPETGLGGGDGRIPRDILDERRRLDQRGCGAALVGGLLAALLERGVEPRLSHRATGLITGPTGEVRGVRMETPDGMIDAHSRGGVIIATGGFEWNDELTRAYLRGPMTSPASYPANTGDGLVMALAAGARVGMMQEAWWVPTVEIPGDELFGRTRAQIVLRERTLPRSIIVNRAGTRFTNESANYNALGGALHQFNSSEFDYANLPCWLVFDHRHWLEYGFAGFREGSPPDWVVRAPDLNALGDLLALPTGDLQATVERWNAQVTNGQDADFGRGSSAYDGWNGDAAHRGTPQATLGPLDEGPFYAVELHSGCLGTKGGPTTDADARVLDHQGGQRHGVCDRHGLWRCWRNARASDHLRPPRGRARSGSRHRSRRSHRHRRTSMKFGLILPIQSTTTDLEQLWEEVRDEVLEAERVGFDVVCLPEFHQAHAPVLTSPLVLGAQLLAITNRIRFAPAVLCGPLHHPMRLAEDYAMLDQTSRGRAILGIGIGHQAPDFAAYGTNRDERGALTDEVLDVFHRAFGNNPFTYDGVHYQLDVSSPLTTMSGARPEIWVGAHSRAGLERAARYGDLWISDPQRDIDTVAVLARRYAEACDQHERTPRVGLFREAFIADSVDECKRVWGDHALAVHRLYYNVGVYRSVFEPWVDDVCDRRDFTFERLAPGRFLVGSGSDIREQVEQWEASTGAETIMMRIRHPGGPGHQSTMEAIRRFGEEVVTPCK